MMMRVLYQYGYRQLANNGKGKKMKTEMKTKMRKSFWAGATALLLLLAGMSAGKTVWAAEKKVAKVALGSTHSAAIDSEGGLWIWERGVIICVRARRSNSWTACPRCP